MARVDKLVRCERFVETHSTHYSTDGRVVKARPLRGCGAYPRGFEPHSVQSSCSSVVEQLLYTANNGGPIPPKNALVDAKTTLSVFGRVVMAAVSRSAGEIRAGSNPGARKPPFRRQNAFSSNGRAPP